MARNFETVDSSALARQVGALAGAPMLKNGHRTFAVVCAPYKASIG